MTLCIYFEMVLRNPFCNSSLAASMIIRMTTLRLFGAQQEIASNYELSFVTSSREFIHFVTSFIYLLSINGKAFSVVASARSTEVEKRINGN